MATAFVAMGIGIIALAGSTTMTGQANWFQRSAGDGVTRFAKAVLSGLAPVPEPVLGIGLPGVAARSPSGLTLRERSTATQPPTVRKPMRPLIRSSRRTLQ